MEMFMHRFMWISNRIKLWVFAFLIKALAFLKPYPLANESDDNYNEEDFDKAKKDNLPYEQNPNQLMTLYEITNEMRKLKILNH